MKVSARNVLKGKVKNINHGMVTSEVMIELSDGVEIVSIISKKSAENLELTKGKEVYAIIKSTNVMVATH
ncbi:MAG: TOBE domain-containing protein [Methanosarcinales archaeon]|nr:TOBE domain-containing protein [Methanosarcinales archaeon]